MTMKSSSSSLTMLTILCMLILHIQKEWSEGICCSHKTLLGSHLYMYINIKANCIIDLTKSYNYKKS